MVRQKRDSSDCEIFGAITLKDGIALVKKLSH